MQLKQIIDARRSVRSYSGRAVSPADLERVLEAGIRAPSGKNGQPWRFIVVQRDRALLGKLAALTVYESFVGTADALIVVLLDKRESYHYVKDCQAVGACIQNMLLTVEDLGLGACWIGEILNRETFVRRLLGLDNCYDLMAVLAVGWPAGETDPPSKLSVDDCVLARR